MEGPGVVPSPDLRQKVRHGVGDARCNPNLTGPREQSESDPRNEGDPSISGVKPSGQSRTGVSPVFLHREAQDCPPTFVSSGGPEGLNGAEPAHARDPRSSPAASTPSAMRARGSDNKPKTPG